MRPPEDVDRVRALAVSGLNYSQIARATGISRATVRNWIVTGRTFEGCCPRCGHPSHSFERLPANQYAYLLGIYLGDGSIQKLSKGVWALRVFQDTKYPSIIREVAAAMASVMPGNRVSVFRKHGGANCAVISSSSKAWPCLFPQAGPGMKHTRKIGLSAWQWAYVWQEPGMFLRGLIHSDGCRVSNKVWHGKYAYPRYFFSNESTDIQQLFRDACDLIGVEYRNNRANSISVARRDSVAKLDAIVGPKR